MYFLTTAPKSWDLPNTLEVEPSVAVVSWEDNQMIRLVDVEKSYVGKQRVEYNSHLHVMLTQEEFARVIDKEVVLLLEPKNYVRIYTDAPECYDWNMYTLELHPHIAESRRKREPVRLVLINKNNGGEAMQCGRYGSGLFMALTHEHYEEQLYSDYGIVVPRPVVLNEDDVEGGLL